MAVREVILDGEVLMTTANVTVVPEVLQRGFTALNNKGELIEGVETDFDIYEGDYEVTPKVTQQTLPTKDKSLIDDITIFQVPYHTTENESGGITVTIGIE